jgi:hypothetical protein
MAVAPSSVAGTVERPPPNLPIGVLAADRMYTSFMDSSYPQPRIELIWPSATPYAVSGAE